MQRLLFEPAWDKTIAPQDRAHIKALFEDTKRLSNEGIHFIPIRQAVNHKGDLLVSVLIHNFNKEDYLFDRHTLHYKYDGKVLATHIFTLPFRYLQQQSSIPWTFIFPKGSFTNTEEFLDGELIFNNA